MKYSKHFLRKCLQILDCMADGYGHLSGVASKLGVSRQSLYRYWRVLRDFGVVVEVSADLWRVDFAAKKRFFSGDRFEVLKSASSNTSFKQDTVRAHAFRLVLPYHFDWSANDRKRFVEKFKPNFVSSGKHASGDSHWLIGNKSTWSGFGFSIGDWKVHLTPKSFIFIMTDAVSLFGENAVDAHIVALNAVRYEVIRELERMLGRSIANSRGAYDLRTAQHHYALIKNALAQEYVRKKLRFSVTTDKGVVFCWIDQSHSPEVEYGNLVESDSDADRHKRLLRSLKDTDLDFYKVSDMFKEASSHIASNAKHLEYYAENMASHVAVNKSIADNIDRFTSVVSKLQGNRYHAPFESVNMSPKDILENIDSINNVNEYADAISALSYTDRLWLSKQLFEKFGGGF